MFAEHRWSFWGLSWGSLSGATAEVGVGCASQVGPRWVGHRLGCRLGAGWDLVEVLASTTAHPPTLRRRAVERAGAEYQTSTAARSRAGALLVSLVKRWVLAPLFITPCHEVVGMVGVFLEAWGYPTNGIKCGAHPVGTQLRGGAVL